MRDYDREWFTLEGPGDVADASRRVPQRPIRRYLGDIPAGDRDLPAARRAMAGDFSTAYNRTNKSAPGRGAISPQDRRSGRTLRGSVCSILAAPRGRDWVVRGADVTDREGVRG
jgi:hypothetical protein